MDVYDFDGTLYRGDSTADFLMWCLRRYPRMATTLPRAGAAAIGCFGLQAIDKTRFKGALYRSLPHVPDIERQVERFWLEHESRIAGPCLPQPGDVVITASPEFLLNDVCTRRGLMLIASLVDPHTGRTLGPNCSEGQKVVRFRELYPAGTIRRFYSDSHKDDPLAHIAEEAFMVKGDELFPWPSGDTD